MQKNRKNKVLISQRGLSALMRMHPEVSAYPTRISAVRTTGFNEKGGWTSLLAMKTKQEVKRTNKVSKYDTSPITHSNALNSAPSPLVPGMGSGLPKRKHTYEVPRPSSCFRLQSKMKKVPSRPNSPYKRKHPNSVVTSSLTNGQESN